MSNQEPGSSETGVTLKIPSILSIKDLITVISVAISLTVAWGVFSTRITVAEREIVSLQNQMRTQDAAIDKLQQQTSRLAAHQQDDELLIDQLYILQNRPIPTRRGIR